MVWFGLFRLTCRGQVFFFGLVWFISFDLSRTRVAHVSMLHFSLSSCSGSPRSSLVVRFVSSVVPDFVVDVSAICNAVAVLVEGVAVATGDYAFASMVSASRLCCEGAVPSVLHARWKSSGIVGLPNVGKILTMYNKRVPSLLFCHHTIF